MKGLAISWFAVMMTLTLIVFALFYYFGNRAYKAEHRRNSDPLTDFPYEMTCGDGNLYKSAKILAFAVAFTDTLASSYMIVLEDLHPALMSFSLLFAVLSLAKNVAFIFMMCIPAYQFRNHILSFTFYCALSVLGLTVSCLLFVNCVNMNFGVALTFAIVIGSLALGGFALLLNPKLGQWTKLDAVVEQDGSVTTSRPRPFPLAATEWAFIALNLLGSILGLIGFFICNLAIM